MVRRRSSAVPHSLLVVDSSCGHNWCLCFLQMGQSWRMWWTVCSASLQWQSAESMLPIRFMCARRPVSCSQPEYSGLLMSCQTVDWVSIGVVVSSGSFPLTFLSLVLFHMEQEPQRNRDSNPGLPLSRRTTWPTRRFRIISTTGGTNDMIQQAVLTTTRIAYWYRQTCIYL